MTKTFKELKQSTSVDEISLKSLSNTIAKSTGLKNTQKAMAKSKKSTVNDLAALRKRLDALKAGYAAESVELEEAMKITHALIDTADGDKVKAVASSEQGVKQSKSSAERPPMSVKDKNTLKIVTLKKPVSQKASEKMVGYPLKESVEQLEELTAAEKKLIDQMYDKKGNLTPLGKKVFAAGQKNEETEIDEAPRRKGAPKMTGDSVAIQRAKDAEHAKAMGRSVKTGRKLPKKTMTSTQMSLASLRREEVELDEAKGMNMNLKLINKIKKSGVVKTGSMSKDGSEKTKTEAVGTSAKHAGKTGMFGGKYTSKDRILDLATGKLNKIRKKRQAQDKAAHDKQDPKMSKMGYAKHMVDVDKADAKARKRGIDPKGQYDRYKKRNGLKEETNEVLDTPKAMQSYKDKANYSRDKAARSAVATALRSKDKPQRDHPAKDLKTMAKRTAGLKMADKAATRKTFKALRKKEDVSEAKKGGYDIYHKDFSGAMQHAYAAAKKNYGITIKPSEIDNKVASGPRKPSNGKTNTYRLEGDKGSIQVQVYNTGNKYELNMYKE